MTTWDFSATRNIAAGLHAKAMAASVMVFSLLIIIPLVEDYQNGGHRWKQGDWLINNHGGMVRRGPVGSALIAVSDVLHVDLLLLTIGLQVGLVLVLVAALAGALTKFENPTAYWLLISSPGFFLVLWGSDPLTGTRKELIAFSAFALLLVACARPKFGGPLTVASLATFFVSVVGHEANVLLAPAFVAVLAISMTQRQHSVRSIVHLGLSVFVVSVGAFLYALAFAQAEFDTVCQPVLDRGLDREVCEGAMQWLSYTSGDGFAAAKFIIAERGLFDFGLGYVLVVLPILYLIALHSHRERLATLFVAMAVPFAPLYVIAIDWGRWIGLHIASFAFVLIALVQTERVKLVTPARGPLIALIAGLSLLWAPASDLGIVDGGVVKEILRHLS